MVKKPSHATVPLRLRWLETHRRELSCSPHYSSLLQENHIFPAKKILDNYVILKGLFPNMVLQSLQSFKEQQFHSDVSDPGL
jgi:hypothetical protein